MSFNAATDRRLQIPSGFNQQAQLATVTTPTLDMHETPISLIGLDTQLLFGALVEVFEMDAGWAFVRAKRDGYIGHVFADALSFDVPKTTHRVIVPRTFVYAEPDMKKPMIQALSLGSHIAVTHYVDVRGSNYAVLDNGFALIANHLSPVDFALSDPLAVAESLLNTPYLWGGASAFGIDCSGLVQLCFAMCGISVLRDTDMQAATLGTPIEKNKLQRGDLIFWKGHVAFYRDDGTIIHANGHTMTVAIEDADTAISRIAYLYGQPVSFRRLEIPIQTYQ